MEGPRNALLGSGFIPIKTHPVKSEMLVAMPKSQANEPIQIDIIIVCRKTDFNVRRNNVNSIIESIRLKLRRLSEIGLTLSENDCKVVYYGELLTKLYNITNYNSMPCFDMDNFSNY